MVRGYLMKAIKGTGVWGIFLISLAVIMGGCGSSKPPPSPETQALKKELLGEINNLTERLIDPAVSRNWQAVEPILQSSYENMKKEGKPVPLQIIVLDQNGITQARFPSEPDRHFDYSQYQPAKTVLKQKRKSQTVLYFGEEKILVLCAPLLQNNKVLGAVGLCYPKNELQKRWNVSEKEFLNLDFNQ